MNNYSAASGLSRLLVFRHVIQFEKISTHSTIFSSKIVFKLR